MDRHWADLCGWRVARPATKPVGNQLASLRRSSVIGTHTETERRPGGRRQPRRVGLGGCGSGNGRWSSSTKIGDGDGHVDAIAGRAGWVGSSPDATAQCAEQTMPIIEFDWASPARHMLMRRIFCPATGAAVTNDGPNVALARAPPSPPDNSSSAAAITNTHRGCAACPIIKSGYYASAAATRDAAVHRSRYCAATSKASTG